MPSFYQQTIMSNFMKNLTTRNNRYRNRLIEKEGQINLSWKSVPKQRRQYLSDLFNTMLDLKWRYSLLMFTVSFLLSWLVFGTLYFFTQLAHGDFVNDQWRMDNVTCIGNSRDFLSCFFFSLEAQSTIGFGYRYPTVNANCWPLVILLPTQTIIGVFLQTMMAGLVFAKLTRPTKRASTIIFSAKAVIEMVDGKLCLLYRVGDMRRTLLAEAHVRLQMVCNRVTAEGELYPFHQSDMDVGYNQGEDRVFLVWPITITHVINEQSPLYAISKADLSTSSFELVAILEGVVSSSGNTTHARTSYLPEEIQWGYRFEKLVSYQRDNGKYKINFEKFHTTYEVSCPEISAKKIDEMKSAGLKPEEIYEAHGLDEIENEGRTPYDTVHPLPGSRRPSVMDHNLLSAKLSQLERTLPGLGTISLSEQSEETEDEHEHTPNERQSTNTLTQM